MCPLLTLDQSTLFYWTLSDASFNKKRKIGSAINNWASTIPTNAKPSHAPKSTSSRTNSDLPSLTSGASRSSAPSLLTHNVKIISHRASDSKVKAEPAPDADTMYYSGGLSDNDEMRGEEREFAINSPPKEKKRLTSEVSLHL